MAGDWLKMDCDLPEKPEVWQIAGLLQIDPDAVVGKLFKVWRWFDKHTVSGQASGVTYALIDSLVALPGFAEAMVFTGWLEQRDRELCLPNFDRHNGKTAKDRADTAKRVAKCKAGKKQEGNEEVTRNTLPRPVVAAIKARDNATCVYCNRPEGRWSPPETAGDARMCIDHVIPLSQGGTDEPRNLVCACAVCNLFKSDRTPDECGLPWPTDENGQRFGNAKSLPAPLPREEKRREEEKKEQVAEIPLKDGSAFAVTASLVADLKAAYPRIDILAEVAKARAWCVTNPDKRKTRGGAAKFLNGWMSRAMDDLPAPSAASLPGGGRKRLGRGS